MLKKLNEWGHILKCHLLEDVAEVMVVFPVTERMDTIGLHRIKVDAMPIPDNLRQLVGTALLLLGLEDDVLSVVSKILL